MFLKITSQTGIFELPALWKSVQNLTCEYLTVRKSPKGKLLYCQNTGEDIRAYEPAEGK